MSCTRRRWIYLQVHLEAHWLSEGTRGQAELPLYRPLRARARAFECAKLGGRKESCEPGIWRERRELVVLDTSCTPIAEVPRGRGKTWNCWSE